MRVGVALCTFNGGAYLRAQLDSIVAQTRPPDLLVVSDDGSRDGTVAELEAFARTAPFPVTLLRGSGGLGPARNFERALAHAAESGVDVIFPCDQDDVWLPEKMAATLRPFAAPAVVIACCNARLTDGTLTPLLKDLWTTLEFTQPVRDKVAAGRAFEVLLRQTFVTGMAMAVRTTAVRAGLPFPEGWLHDEWLSLMVAANGGTIALVPEELVLYRQHGANVLGAKSMRPAEALVHAFRLPRARYQDFSVKADRAAARLNGHAPPDRVAEVAARARHYAARAALPRPRLLRTAAIARELMSGRYARFSLGVRSAARDVLASPR